MLFTGRVTQVDDENDYCIVDTGNDDYRRLRVYKVDSSVQIGDTVLFDTRTSQRGYPYGVFKRIEDRNTSIYNTEDRAQWYEEGENLERYFVGEIAPRFSNGIIINPEKRDEPWKMDLYDTINDCYADLKNQQTPFFTAFRYAKPDGTPYDPTYTVTFNKKDYENYIINYQDADIYFWVDWKQLRYKDYSVSPIKGIWRARFRDIARVIEEGEVPLHSYQFRRNDDHNAQDSYLLDLNDPQVFTHIIDL